MRDDEEEIVSDWKFAAMVIDREAVIVVVVVGQLYSSRTGIAIVGL